MQPLYCPNCGAGTSTASRYCPRCGEDLLARQSALDSNVQTQDRATPLPVAPFSPMTPPASPRPTSEPGFAPAHPPQGGMPGYQPVQPATPPPPSRRARGGLGKIFLIIVLVLAFLSSGGYIAYALLSGNATQPQITSRTLNTTVKYAGIDVTITQLEQATSFTDDPHSSSDGMLRIHLQAENKTSVPTNMVYSEITRLVLPGGKIVTPTYVNGNAGLAAGKSHSDYVDFAVASNTNLDKLALRLGGPKDAQMDLPLSTRADLSEYQPHSTKIGKPLESKTSFYGLNWTLDSANTQWCIDGKQAEKGMRFVVVNLTVASTLEQTAIPGSPFDYARLKAGGTTATPSQSTLPVSFEKGKSTQGTITFQVPQNQTSLTLSLEPGANSGFDSAQVTFTLP
ncbi:zinc ribbon domain-containing protein [Ktedonospora formicarum]|uniref:Zinc-ribbon domain-containing protein n=1 Tax=Ktedonospora formicarum TaxID=2778364 RepID=A0A8J3IB03_9CHLR|nr:zinc ribbon domain-containing protein [Ktedonospora formicarum]GHO50010.1 hypothetical protein KSX_81730 [Ktedonospora formicarum]